MTAASNTQGKTLLLYNRAYLAPCLQHSAQIQPYVWTSDTLGTSGEIVATSDVQKEVMNYEVAGSGEDMCIVSRGVSHYDSHGECNKTQMCDE